MRSFRSGLSRTSEVDRFVVIDCETTGLGQHDRVVEVAAVTVDSRSLDVVDEFDTLINPQRDVGPVDIHGVSASMVEAAPTFEEVGAMLGSKLDGAVLVAHNLRFDTRMLGREFERLDSKFDEGEGICTLAATQEKLIHACTRYGIDLSHQHRALADARATAALLVRCLDSAPDGIPAAVDTAHLSLSPRTLRRDALDSSGSSDLQRVISSAYFPTSDSALLEYLDMLDWVLDDLMIDEQERRSMTALIHELGLSADAVARAHENYFSALVSAAQRDGIITEQENDLMSRVAAALGLDVAHVPEVSATSADVNAIQAGARVCFTGTAVVAGTSYGRTELEACAASAGLQPVSAVTKKGCDLLVAAGPSSMSGKAKKAREWGLPVISVEQFLDFCGV